MCIPPVWGSVGFGVFVGFCTSDWVGLGVEVGRGVAVGIGVFVGFGVFVGAGVFDGAIVLVGAGVEVGRGVAVGIGVLVGFGVFVGLGAMLLVGMIDIARVGDGVGDTDGVTDGTSGGVAVGVKEGVSVGDWVPVQTFSFVSIFSGQETWPASYTTATVQLYFLSFSGVNSAFSVPTRLCGSSRQVAPSNSRIVTTYPFAPVIPSHSQYAPSIGHDGPAAFSRISCTLPIKT